MIIQLYHLLFHQMGGILSSEAEATENSNGFVVISNAIETELHFDPSQSYLLSIGIDKQLHPNYKHKSLGPTVKLDALETALTLVKQFNIKSFDVYCSSDQPENTSHAGIKDAITNGARSVGKDGLLVLFFGGHGINYSNMEWGLAPSDYDHTPDTYITMSTLTLSLMEGNCMAKHILVILDCCYSGVMANNMTSISSSLIPHLYVLAAGTDYESSLSVGPLRHSIFSYFLKYSINKTQPHTEGVLPIIDIFEECKICCYALSTLVLCKDPNAHDFPSLKVNQTLPTLSHFEPLMVAEEVDAHSLPAAGRLEFVLKLFDSTRCGPHPTLHLKTHGWLKGLVQFSDSPLTLLAEKGLLIDKGEGSCVLNAVISLMMHSIALIEVTFNGGTAADPNAFLIAFVNVIATIDLICPPFDIDVAHLRQSLLLYNGVLVKNSVDNHLMKELYQKVVLSEKNVEEVDMKVR